MGDDVKILVTGGTGFIGTHAVAALINAGHSVRLLVRDADKMQRVFEPHNVVIEDYVLGDIVDEKAVQKALNGCEAVIHAAAMVATSEKYAEQVYHTNVNGTRNVIGLAVAADIKHIIFMSSVTAIISPHAESVNEESEVGTAENIYGRSKIDCEHFVRGLQAKGAQITVLYPVGVIGPYDPALSEAMGGIQYFLTTCSIVTPSGVQYIDVRDCAEIILRIVNMDAAPDRLILGGHYYSWTEEVDILDELTGRKIPRIPMSSKNIVRLGIFMDFIHKLSGLNMPLTKEAATLCGYWCFADGQKLKDTLGFEYRDKRETFTDTLKWFGQAGHVSSKKLGKLG
jgi:nucleoside-diphosphate-sugar epimerase